MSNSYHDLHQLSECLEAELNGHPYDRVMAQRLADQLAHQFPAIHNSMRLLVERFGNLEEASAVA